MTRLCSSYAHRVFHTAGEIVLQCVRYCVVMCSRLCKVAEESLFHMCCSENESRRGCELHQSTKAPKHWQRVHQCTKHSAPGQRSPEQGSAERVLSSQESSPPFLFLPSSSILLGAVLVRSIFENQKSTSAPPPLGTFILSQPAPTRVVEFFQFFLLSDTGGP